MRAEANVSNCESARCREIHLHFCRVFPAALTFRSLAAEAREVVSLAQTNLAAWKEMASRQAMAPKTMLSELQKESLAEPLLKASMKPLEHSAGRDSQEPLVRMKLRR